MRMSELELEQRTNIKFLVCFLLGYSQASEFCVPTFRNTLSVPSSQAGGCVKNELGLGMLGYYMGKGLARN